MITHMEYPQAFPGKSFEVPNIEGRGIKVKTTPVVMATYEATGGTPVEVTCREFDRISGEESSSERSAKNEIVVLPGVGLDVGTKTAQSLGESFVRCRNGGKTYMIRSKITKKIENPLDEETRAIEKFIEEKKLENFVLVGNSQGGDRAITIAAELGNKVRALVLVDSVGLYNQDPAEMAKQFFKNSGIDTPKDLIANLVSGKGKGRSHSIKIGLQSGADVMFGIINDIRHIREDNPDYLDRIKQEVETMAKKNPHLADIRIPVVLISGRSDPISDPSRIAPISERHYNPEIHTPLGKELFGKNAGNQVRVKNTISRNEYLQKELFPNSPWVRMIVPVGGHGGQLFRSDAVATAALGSIERGWRETKRKENGSQRI